jgi:hypothetical protein
LVIFDLNRMTDMLHLLKEDPKPRLKEMLSKSGQTFSLTVLTNVGPRSRRIVAKKKELGQATFKQTPLALTWPEGLYSLAHVALPFSPEDPLYGRDTKPDCPHVQLGEINLRGERNSLFVSPADILRQRWNPFFPYIERRLIEFVGLGPEPPALQGDQ